MFSCARKYSEPEIQELKNWEKRGSTRNREAGRLWCKRSPPGTLQLDGHLRCASATLDIYASHFFNPCSTHKRQGADICPGSEPVPPPNISYVPQFVICSLQNSKRLNKSQVTTHKEVCRSHRIDSILQKLSAHTRDYLRGTNWLSQGKQCPEEWPDIQLGLIVCWTIKCKKQVGPSAVICRRWSFSGSAFTGHTHLESRF